VPTVLFIDEGVYGAERLLKFPNWSNHSYFTMKKPLSMYGAGRGKTTLVGVGLKIEGKRSDGIVEIEDLTIKGPITSFQPNEPIMGLEAHEGMKVIMRGCTVEDCQQHGVSAWDADISCDDLQVVGCGKSGVCVYGNATITLSGQGTTIQGNGTIGDSFYYGLSAYSSSSKIHIVHPITKEQISNNNGGGGNWGGMGTIGNKELCEEARRRQLGFNEQNPWSQEREREQEEARRRRLGFNEENPWSQEEEERIRELGFNENNPWSQEKEDEPSDY